MKNILGAYLTPHPPIIIEEIGKGEEEKARATIQGMNEISKDIKDKAPDTIVLITPHGPLFSDAIAILGEEDLEGSFRNFGFRELKYSFKNNLKLVQKILEKSSKEDLAMVKIDKENAPMYKTQAELDHGALVPLHFIEKEYKDFQLVHITYGLLPPKDLYRFGKLIKESLIELDENAIIIASGDLSHKLSDDGPYSYSPSGKEFDEEIIDIIKRGSLKEIITFDLELSEKAGECGLRSLMIMAGCLDRYDIKSRIVSYEGPFGVGYGTAIIDVTGENQIDILKDVSEKENLKIQDIRNRESDYVKLARESLEHFINTGEYLQSKEESDIRKAVFVTLKKDGILRGCVGTTEPTQLNIEDEIINNAVSAGTKDNRFPRVRKEELASLVYSVDVLSEPERVASRDELDIDKYGIIVSYGFRRGLLLPNIDGVESVKDQIRIALNKADIDIHEDYTIEKFKVTRHH